MGCTAGQAGACEGDESPVHPVTVSPFWIGENEVIQGLSLAVTGRNPSHFSRCGDTCPVDSISWYDAVKLCTALSGLEGLHPAYLGSGTSWTWDRTADGYRLPTGSARTNAAGPETGWISA